MKTPAQMIQRYQLPANLVRDTRSASSDRDWYSIENKTDLREAVVRIYDEIGFWGVTAGEFVAELDALDVDTIHLRINSPGGAVWDAMAIYHTLREHPATVHAVVDGIAASAASFILQAGDTRHANASTRVMIHSAQGWAGGSAEQLREYADLLDAVTRDIADVYAARTTDDADTWLARMTAGDTWYSATDAAAVGLVDTTDDETTNKIPVQPTNALKGRPMDPETDDPTITNRFKEIERDLALLRDAGHAPAPVSALGQFKSFGQYVQAFAAGRDDALEAYKQLRNAYEGPEETDTIMFPQWLGMIIGQMRALQPTLAVVQHTYDLPEEGNTVEYGRIEQVKGTTGVQAKWGDPFTKDATVKLNTETATITTIGGWAEFARQWVARSSVPVLDLLWKGLALSYARDIEARARAQLNTTWAARTAVGVAPIATTTLGFGDMTALDWRALMIDIRDATYDAMWPLDGFLVSPDVYKALAALIEQRPALQPRQAPTDKVGTLDLAALSGDLDGFTVRYLPGWGSGRFGGYWSGAIRVQEKPGAPLQLTGAEDVTNLVTPISLWGEVVDYAPVPEAILPVKFEA